MKIRVTDFSRNIHTNAVDNWQLTSSRLLGRLMRAGMGTRRKSSRPRRDRDETETLASPAETKPRRDFKISRRDRDETFVALET